MKQETREVFLDMRTRHEGATCQTVDSREVRTDGRGREGLRGSAARDEDPSLSAHPPGHSTPCSSGHHTGREGANEGAGATGTRRACLRIPETGRGTGAGTQAHF